MKKTLYVSDLDGTLLNSGARLSEYTVNTLNRLLGAGLLFTCATARSSRSARPILAGLHLRLPMAGYNGAFLIDPADGKLLDSCIMDSAQLRPLLEQLVQMRAAPLVYTLRQGAERVAWLQNTTMPGVRQYIADRPNDPRLYPADGYKELFSGDIFHLTFIGSQAQMRAVRDVAAQNAHVTYHLSRDTYHPDEYWMEITRRDADKAHAVQRLKALCGADEVVCFGDNMNDLPMFRMADRCYAVANACGELKSIATGIIGSNDEDGVARWLEENAEYGAPAP